LLINKNNSNMSKREYKRRIREQLLHFRKVSFFLHYDFRHDNISIQEFQNGRRISTKAHSKALMKIAKHYYKSKDE